MQLYNCKNNFSEKCNAFTRKFNNLFALVIHKHLISKKNPYLITLPSNVLWFFPFAARDDITENKKEEKISLIFLSIRFVEIFKFIVLISIA